MQWKKITPNQFVVSDWSGGKTTQIAIDPPEAVYAERNFHFRVSSASVELEESEFTPLPDYERMIAPVKGRLFLYYNESQKPEVLEEMEFSRFDGAWNTRSKGKVTDYNLMTRKGICTGDAFGRTLKPGEECDFPLTLPEATGRNVLLIWCAEGQVDGSVGDDLLKLSTNQAIQLDNEGFTPDIIKVKNGGGVSAKLMIARVCFTGTAL